MAVRLPQPLRPAWPVFKAAYTKSTRAVAPFTWRLSRVRGGYLPGASVALADESVERGGGRVWVAKPAEELRRALPLGEPSRHPTFVAELNETIPRVAVAELPNGRVLGPHRAVIDRTGAMVDEFSPYWGTTRSHEHPVFWHPFPGAPVEVDGRLGVLAGRGDESYYHFLVDILPRLAILEAPGVSAPDLWYVPRQRRFQREILALAGFPATADQIIDSDVVPHVRALELLVPGLPDTHLRTPPWAVRYVRNRLLRGDRTLVPGRRIYVTRGGERHNRTIRNESQVVDLLSGFGFRVIDPGALPVAAQIDAFAEAEWIVAPHGAALANLAFASPGASVLELFSPDYVQGCYWKLASCVPGVTYRYLVGAGSEPRTGRMRGVMSDITVDLAKLSEALGRFAA